MPCFEPSIRFARSDGEDQAHEEIDMKDQRLQVFRTTIDAVLESLQAVVRLARWTGTEAKPESLVASASKLLERLGTADRLSVARFTGRDADVAKVGAMCAAMKRLDAAYVAYMQSTRTQSDPKSAADTLESEIAATAATSGAWD
jgi:hypothetical protein